MLPRKAVALLVVALIPTVVWAQRHGGMRGGGRPAGQHSGSNPGRGMGSGHGHGQSAPTSAPLTIGPGRGLAPYTGYGNINHPGLGFAPNTPGIGYPVGSIQPLVTLPQPLIGPIRPGVAGYSPHVGYGGGYGGRRGLPYPAGSYYGGYGRYGYNYGYGGVSVIGVPVPVPVLVEGYGYPYGYAQPPQVIIIQPGAQGQYEAQAEERPRHWPAPTRGETGEKTLIYETRAPTTPAAEEKPSRPLTLLIFKNRSIYAVTDYWKDGDRLCYDTSYGTQNCVSLDLLDLELTKKLNDERNVKFEL